MENLDLLEEKITIRERFSSGKVFHYTGRQLEEIIENAHKEALKLCLSGELAEHGIYNEEQLREQISVERRKINQGVYIGMKTTEGVFRLPQEAEILHEKVIDYPKDLHVFIMMRDTPGEDNSGELDVSLHLLGCPDDLDHFETLLKSFDYQWAKMKAGARLKVADILDQKGGSNG